MFRSAFGSWQTEMKETGCPRSVCLSIIIEAIVYIDIINYALISMICCLIRFFLLTTLYIVIVFTPLVKNSYINNSL